MPKKETYILALDISSKCTGYAYGTNESLMKYGKFISDKDDTHAKALFNFAQWLNGLITNLNRPPHIIAIEDNYFRQNIKTYGVLNQFLGVAQKEIYRISQMEPMMVAPSKIKNVLKPKKGKNYYENKYNMVKRINSLFGINLKYHKSSKLKSDDDVADGIALYYTVCLGLENE